MRTKVTLVLIFLNVVLFYYIFEYEGKYRTEQRLLEARRRVFGSEVAAIDSFVRTERAGPTVRAEKRVETWWLTQPYEWPANLNAISRILNELQLLEHDTSFAVAALAQDGRSLAEYGLADPAITFAFTSGGKQYVVRIGADTKIGNRLYLLSPDGTRIHVVGRSLADSLGLTLDSLRAESIFTVPVFEVRSLGLQTAAPANLKVRLRRDGARWSFETPIVARADKNRVEVAINSLNALQAKRFVEGRDADLDRTGLSSPQLRVTLEGNARRETLLLGAAAGAAAPEGTEYFAKVEDKAAIFTTIVPARLVEELRSAQEALRDPRILDFEPRTITALTLVAPGQSELSIQRLEAAQGAEAWQLVVRGANGQAPQTLPADAAVVRGLLEKLQRLAARKFLSDAPSATDLENWGFNRPERELTLNLNTGGGPRGTDPSTLALLVGVKPDERGAAYARVANAPFVFEIDPEILEATPVSARYFRQRLVRELPVGARVTGLTLGEIGVDAPLYAHQLAAGIATWDLALALEPEARRKALTTLLNQARSLRALRFTADTFNPDHAEVDGGSAPWKYRLEFTLTLTGGNGAAQTSTMTLLLTDRLGGTTQLAGSSEFSGGVTFAVTPETMDALFALTYAEKHDPGPPPKTPSEPAKPEPPKTDAPAGK
jgi:hypothetical protein